MDPITLVLLGGAGFLWWKSRQESRPTVPPGYVPVPQGQTAPALPPPASPPARSAPPKPKPVPTVPGPTANVPKVKDVQRLDAAAVLAVMVVKDVTAKSLGYNKELMKRFQKTAGISVDGKYGPETAGAAAWYTKGKLTAPPSFPRWGKGYKTYFPPF